MADWIETSQDTKRVLAPHESPPLEVVNTDGKSDFFLICEHAGNRIPESLGDMGLTQEDLLRHIAWDIGARAVAMKLSKMLDAPLYMQRYSRLVCDCNRRPDVPGFAPEQSEATKIPANQNLSAAERKARAQDVFWPFHNAVTAALDAREAAGRTTKLITVHSFTPVFNGEERPWEIGVLFNRDRNFAPRIFDWLTSNTDLMVGSNEPYAVGDDSDYAIPIHGEKRGIPCVEFEIRNDLIADPANAGQWAGYLRDAVEGV